MRKEILIFIVVYNTDILDDLIISNICNNFKNREISWMRRRNIDFCRCLQYRYSK